MEAKAGEERENRFKGKQSGSRAGLRTTIHSVLFLEESSEKRIKK